MTIYKNIVDKVNDQCIISYNWRAVSTSLSKDQNAKYKNKMSVEKQENAGFI